MECSLQHLLNIKMEFTLEMKIDILEDICLGIQYLHNEQNIIHKDIKPGNILISEMNGRYHAKICDFGISKRMDPNKTTTFHKTEEMKFSPMYVPPEYYNNKEISRGGDMYSLGLLMHILLFGIHLFDGLDNNQILDKIQKVFLKNLIQREYNQFLQKN
jgi:serine/threonine protein kinase